MLKIGCQCHGFTAFGSMICGHHVYKDILTPFTGEILRVEQEAHNTINTAAGSLRCCRSER